MFTIQVKGLNQLIKKNKLMIQMLERGDPAEELVKRIVRSAKHFAPRRTGALVKSIKYERISKTKFKIFVTATNEKGEPYPMYLEIGTRYIKVGTAANPRVYKSSSGKQAQLPYIGSAIHRSTTKKDINAVVKRLLSIYN